MKVIHQLVSYFERRGVLSAEQIAYLRREGFYPAAPHEEEFDLVALEEAIVDESGDEFEAHEEREWARIVREKRARSRAGGGTRRRARPRRSVAVTERLAAGIPAWEDQLAPLQGVARRLGPAPLFIDAFEVIVATDAEALHRALRAAFDTRAPSLRALWAALSVEEYRTLLDEPALKGPALVAYEEILATAGEADAGAFDWLWRKPEVRWVCGLIRAQRALLVAAGQLYHREPAALAGWLAQSRQSGAYWPFVLLHSAVRFDPRRPQAPVRPNRSEQEPARPLPELPGWLQVWAQAMIMDPAHVEPFFAHRFVPLLSLYGMDGGDGDEDAARAALLCPSAWDR